MQIIGFINAGGRGTRLESIFPKDSKLGITKALLPFGSTTLVDYQIERLLAAGFEKVVVSAGDHTHLVEYISARYGSDSRIGVVCFSEQLGTGGDLIRFMRQEVVPGGLIFVVNVDTLLRMSEQTVVSFHVHRRAGATIVLTRKSGVPNEGSWARRKSDGLVLHSKEASVVFQLPEPNCLDCEALSSTGAVLLDTRILSQFEWDPEDHNSLSLYRDILGWCVCKKILYGYDNSKGLFLDIGTPDSYGKMTRRRTLSKLLLSELTTYHS